MTAFDKAWDMVKLEVKPFKLRSRKEFPCDHNMELTDEDEVEGILYHTYTCSKCGESHTSSPS